MNWYKAAAKSRLISVPLKAKLKQTDDGFIYLDIPNSMINAFYSLIDEKDIEKPPYDKAENNKIGAHISVMNQDEFDEPTEIAEIGEDFSFKLSKIYSTKPDGWDEMEHVWFISVESPDLEKLRKKYGLSKKHKGHDFHITVAVKKKRRKAASLSEYVKKNKLTPGMIHFLKSMGFDEKGKPIEVKNKSVQDKKRKQEWREQEYEHMPA